MRTLIAATFMIGFLAVIPARSQETQTSPATQTPAEMAKPSSNPAQSDADKAKDSTIVFFRDGHFNGSALQPSIFLDAKQLDRLTNGRSFAAHPEPGKHQLQPNPQSEPATLIHTVQGHPTPV